MSLWAAAIPESVSPALTVTVADLDAHLAAQDIPAYGVLLLGVLDGDATHSIRDDEAEAAWRLIEPVAAGWRADLAPLGEYVAGSADPPHEPQPVVDQSSR